MNEFEFIALITFITALFLATMFISTLVFIYYIKKGGKK